jgi:hypothetical protein
MIAPIAERVIEVIHAGMGELEHNKIGKKDICFCNQVKIHNGRRY